MPLAVTHVLLPIVTLDIYRDYFVRHRRKYFTLQTIFIAGIAGLLPDIDVPLSFFLSKLGISSALFMHGGITHTALFGLVFLVPGFYYLKKERHHLATYFFVISFGIFFHLLLDYVLGGGRFEGIMWFWPISSQGYKIHLFARLGWGSLPQAIDAVILVLWLWHEEARHKIRDFI